MNQSEMTPSAATIVAIPVRDLQACARSYETVLGVPRGYRWADMGLEFQVGYLTLR